MITEPHLLANQTLITAIIAGSIAQVLKVLISYLLEHSWNWSLLLQAGGMPSSHSALVAATAQSIGLNFGFGSPIFTVAVIIAIVVIYDATGIRRQAGIHAAIINRMITDLASGHPLKEEQLREVLGHTPFEAFTGTILGVATAYLFWILWK